MCRIIVTNDNERKRCGAEMKSGARNWHNKPHVKNRIGLQATNCHTWEAEKIRENLLWGGVSARAETEGIEGKESGDGG